MKYLTYNFKNQTIPTLVGLAAGLALTYVGFGKVYEAQFFVSSILIGFSLLARVE